MPLTAIERSHVARWYNSRTVVVKQGDLLEVTYVTSQPARRRPGRRKAIVGFSPSSRLRLLKRMATVYWEGIGKSLFCTLTYPDDVVNRTKDERTVDRHRLFRDMEKHLDREIALAWRIEWKARKSGKWKGQLKPHVHLIVFNVRWFADQDLRSIWRRVLGVNGYLRTEAKRIENERDVARYVAKYIGKQEEDRSLVIASYLNTVGRAWGFHRPELIPWCVRTWDLNCTEDEIALLENAAASKIPYFPTGTRSGFSLFGPIVKKVMEEIRLRRIDTV
jgi:hypothetical protein